MKRLLYVNFERLGFSAEIWLIRIFDITYKYKLISYMTSDIFVCNERLYDIWIADAQVDSMNTYDRYTVCSYKKYTDHSYYEQLYTT